MVYPEFARPVRTLAGPWRRSLRWTCQGSSRCAVKCKGAGRAGILHSCKVCPLVQCACHQVGHAAKINSRLLEIRAVDALQLLLLEPPGRKLRFENSAAYLLARTMHDPLPYAPPQNQFPELLVV